MKSELEQVILEYTLLFAKNGLGTAVPFWQLSSFWPEVHVHFPRLNSWQEKTSLLDNLNFSPGHTLWGWREFSRSKTEIYPLPVVLQERHGARLCIRYKKIIANKSATVANANIGSCQQSTKVPVMSYEIRWWKIHWMVIFQ